MSKHNKIGLFSFLRAESEDTTVGDSTITTTHTTL